MVENPTRQDPTLQDFIRALLPRGWSTEDLFTWPPDIFLLTSSIFKVTGVYRYAVLPPENCWPDEAKWDEAVRKAATEWRKWMIGPESPMPERIAGYLAKLANYSGLSISDIASGNGQGWTIESTGRRSEATSRCWDLCRALLELHAIADEACHGFGLPSGFYSRNEQDVRSEMSAIDFHANMLLANTGSLSRISRHHGVVLPKMRTPQVGMTLRSLSHHVTYQLTEVEVIWRTLPWVNIDEDTINILIVPWPKEMHASWFKPVSEFVKRKSKEPARYFSYSHPLDDQLLEKLQGFICEAKKSVHRIHVIVFPEMSLTPDELVRVKNHLARHLDRDSIPMIVSGLREAPDVAGKDSKNERGFNKIVLSTFFAGKWYDLSQHKHHRWRLDDFQIRQYKLGGALSASKQWWEAIRLPPRRLMFLAPNGWLTLCPLICEDLARFEPVSEVIRGVGPTLLIAILLDGPQLPERWPGRYASVLADDPGTSVLTVSSLGMANRAVPQNQEDKEGHVALWKDQLTNWGHIKLKKNQEAVVVTLAASWYEEYTADGRGDGTAAAVFSLKGFHGLEGLSGPGRKISDPSENTKDGERGDDAAEKPSLASEPGPWEPSTYDSSDEGDNDVSELTTFSYFADAALDAPDEMIDRLASWAIGKLAENDWQDLHFRAGRTVWDLYRKKACECTEEFYVFVEWFASFLKRVPFDSESSVYWDRLVSETQSVLENATVENHHHNLRPGDCLDRKIGTGSLKEHEALRVEIYTALSVLWSVHRRLARKRQESGLTHITTRLMDRVETLLKHPYDKEWYRAREMQV